MNPWIAVDLDGTLAEYGKWQGATHVGAPIPKMVDRVKSWLAAGQDVRIFTARVYPLLEVKPNDNIDQVLSSRGLGNEPRAIEAANATLAIQKWCQEHLGKIITITCVKDYGLVAIWADRAIQIIKNTGLRADLNDDDS